MKHEVVIIGAGASGLMAMKTLLEAGYKVLMLEASPGPGGRIQSIQRPGFDQLLEAGPEFIHGKLPLTMKILKEAGIPFQPLEGNMITINKGEWKKQNVHDEHWKEFQHKLKQLRSDLSIRDFLVKNFSEPEYIGLRSAVQHYAEGFDLADISKASILSVREEWKHEDDPQFRIPGGYGQLIRYLYNCCLEKKGLFSFKSPVLSIRHSKNTALIQLKNNNQIKARRVILTVPVEILKGRHINIEPLPLSYSDALDKLEMGPVIKFFFQFNSPFWNKYAENVNFFLSDEPVPTWWTQLPIKNNLLTGWLGGPNAKSFSKKSNKELFMIGMQSISSIFSIRETQLKKRVVNHKIINWQKNPFSRGGYSYDSIHSEKAVKVLNQPLNNNMFLAGEALSQGKSRGTVEAALESGQAVARKIIKE